MTPEEHYAAAERLMAGVTCADGVPTAHQHTPVIIALAHVHALLAQAGRGTTPPPEPPGWSGGRRVPIPVEPKPPLAADPDRTMVFAAVEVPR